MILQPVYLKQGFVKIKGYLIIKNHVYRYFLYRKTVRKEIDKNNLHDKAINFVSLSLNKPFWDKFFINAQKFYYEFKKY
jgi:hypothetical protein